MFSEAAISLVILLSSITRKWSTGLQLEVTVASDIRVKIRDSANETTVPVVKSHFVFKIFK